MVPLAYFSFFFNLVLIFFSSFWILSCSSTSGGGVLRENNEEEGFYLLTLKPANLADKKSEISEIHIDTKTSFYENDELSHKSTRKLRLKVSSEMELSESEDTFWIKNTTIEKKGNEELHAFGLPELNETIRLKLDSRGRVREVEGYPKSSIFYLPPVLLPKTRVKIGDSWGDTFQWKGEGQPLDLETTIECRLAGIEKWKGQKAFKIEMLAQSKFKETEEIFLKSTSEGYFLWDHEKSLVLFAKSLGKDIVTSNVNQRSVTQTLYISKYLGMK